jgi:phosphoribosyl 1,2-cyclic phosphodiesterase
MSGREYLRYGGNTTSIELVTDRGERLLIDLGTGATELAKALMATEFGKGQGKLPILLTHTHLDHIQGLPFFTPFFIKGNEIRILGANPSSGLALEATLQNQLAPHYSPLNGLENLAAGVSIESFAPGSTFTVPGYEITSAALPHGSMWTTGFRISADGKVVTILTDVEYPAPENPLPAALELARDADLLVHDAMHADHDYNLRRGWGHSPTRAGVIVAERAGAKKLALFHHNPDATDDMIDELVRRTSRGTNVPVFAATEGLYIDV